MEGRGGEFGGEERKECGGEGRRGRRVWRGGEERKESVEGRGGEEGECGGEGRRGECGGEERKESVDGRRGRRVWTGGEEGECGGEGRRGRRVWRGEERKESVEGRRGRSVEGRGDDRPPPLWLCLLLRPHRTCHRAAGSHSEAHCTGREVLARVLQQARRPETHLAAAALVSVCVCVCVCGVCVRVLLMSGNCMRSVPLCFKLLP